MKNFFIVLFVLVLVGAGGYFGWRYYQSQANVSPNLNKKTNSFVWGVTARPHAINKYNTKDWTKLVGYAKDLGVNYVRLNWESDVRDPMKFNKATISEIEKQGMKPYVVITQTGDMTKSADPYTDGYNRAYTITKAVKGRVDYYQLENEITSWSLKGAEFSGDKADQYDETKSQKIIQWLKGTNAGVKAGDPEAKTVVAGQWIQYSFLQMIADGGVDYDIIGWDWFSDMGLIQDNKLDDGSNIMDKLKTFNKPIMLVEVGQRPDGSTMDQDKQAKYISDMAEWAHGSGLIKGFFAFELTDGIPVSAKIPIEVYGLVEAKRLSTGKGAIVGPRKAYATYKDIIAKYSQ